MELTPSLSQFSALAFRLDRTTPSSSPLSPQLADGTPGEF